MKVNSLVRPRAVEEDFAAMSAHGLNAVRKRFRRDGFLILAGKHGLYVMAGLPWEQHVDSLDGWKQARGIQASVREAVRSCAVASILLCFAVGNEIPSSIVRWHGHRRIEQHLRQLCETVKSEDPEALVTYVNYPTTEYLDLPLPRPGLFHPWRRGRIWSRTWRACSHCGRQAPDHDGDWAGQPRPWRKRSVRSAFVPD